MDLNHRYTAFYEMTTILLGTHKYVSEIYDGYKEPLYFIGDPFSGDKYMFTEFYGSPGITASIGYFLRRVLEEAPEGIDMMRLHYLPEYMDGKKIGDAVFAEIVQGNTNVICGGMTNYSGEGGSGYHTVRRIFELLNEMLNIPFGYVQDYTEEQSTVIQHTIDKMYQKAWEEREAENAEYQSTRG